MLDGLPVVIKDTRVLELQRAFGALNSGDMPNQDHCPRRFCMKHSIGCWVLGIQRRHTLVPKGQFIAARMAASDMGTPFVLR